MDQERLAYSVAGAVLAGAWDVAGVRAGLERVGGLHGVELKGLARGVLKAFGERPGFYELVAFLGRRRGLRRLRGGREVGGMREGISGLREIAAPALGTVGAVAGWLGVRVGRLEWLADVAGRNRRAGEGREAFDLLKAILTNCVRHGAAAQNREGVGDFRAHLAGRVAQVAAVHAGRGERLWGIFRRIAW